MYIHYPNSSKYYMHLKPFSCSMFKIFSCKDNIITPGRPVGGLTTIYIDIYMNHMFSQWLGAKTGKIMHTLSAYLLTEAVRNRHDGRL